MDQKQPILGERIVPLIKDLGSPEAKGHKTERHIDRGTLLPLFLFDY